MVRAGRMAGNMIDDTNAGPKASIFAGHLYGVSPSVHQDVLNRGKHVWMSEHYIDGRDDLGACMSIAKEIRKSPGRNFLSLVSRNKRPEELHAAGRCDGARSRSNRVGSPGTVRGGRLQQ